MPLCSTALQQEGGVSSWPASPLLSSNMVAWESSGRMPVATPQTALPSISLPVSLPPQLKEENY